MKPYDSLPHFYDPQPKPIPRVNPRRDAVVMLAALVITSWLAAIGLGMVIYWGIKWL